MKAAAFMADRSFGHSSSRCDPGCPAWRDSTAKHAWPCSLPFSSSTKDPMQALQQIPVITDVETPAAIVALELFRLFDATAHARPYTVTLHERNTPGAAAALRAWSAANGLAAVEDHYPSLQGRPAYANLTTAITEYGTRIIVLAYRELTDGEAAVTAVAK